VTALLASEMPNASHLVKDDQSPVASSFRSPAMAFADRAVVMNGGRIEQIGMPRAKREPSPNQSVALVVPRGGLARASNSNGLECQTAARDGFDPQRQFGALSNPSYSPTQMSSEGGRKKSEIKPRKQPSLSHVFRLSQVDLKDRRRGRYP